MAHPGPAAAPGIYRWSNRCRARNCRGETTSARHRGNRAIATRADSVHVAVGAVHVLVDVVEHNAGHTVVEVLLVPAVEVAGLAARVVGLVLAGVVVAFLALQDLVIGLQGPTRGGVIEQVVASCGRGTRSQPLSLSWHL